MISSKTFLNNDITTIKTLLHEAISITGSILSGTYPAGGAAGSNIKFTSPYYVDVYDYPFLSSSANLLFGASIGFAADSEMRTQPQPDTAGFLSDKLAIYNNLASTLMGFDETGVVRNFDNDGNFFNDVGEMKECIFVNIASLLGKDGIKMGSFSIELGVSGSYSDPFGERVILQDSSGSNGYFVNGNMGNYGTLFITNSKGTPTRVAPAQRAGVIFYEGLAMVLTASIFQATDGLLSSSVEWLSDGTDIHTAFTGSSIRTNITGGFLHRVFA